ncbi:MAG: hypothetical protein JJU11_02810 [Candidatus Sumerlaeia bacterium]|nr:hypothetical protein [Candidatus Sumerlaeia bacterium]
MHLTEKEFGRLLNVCQKTVRLYERGALPKEEHAGLIKDLIERQTTVDSSLFDSMKSGQMNALFSIDLAQPQVNDWPNASPLNFTFRPTPPLQPDDRNCHLAA